MLPLEIQEVIVQRKKVTDINNEISIERDPPAEATIASLRYSCPKRPWAEEQTLHLLL